MGGNVLEGMDSNQVADRANEGEHYKNSVNNGYGSVQPQEESLPVDHGLMRAMDHAFESCELWDDGSDCGQEAADAAKLYKKQPQEADVTGEHGVIKAMDHAFEACEARNDGANCGQEAASAAKLYRQNMLEMVTPVEAPSAVTPSFQPSPGLGL